MNYTYDEAVLKRLQATELDMLKTFDRICTKYNITYFVAFGTALGAVRHQGFIPWDDDIDLSMMREDYEKLRKVPSNEWGDLLLVDPEDGFGPHKAIFSRIYKKGTVFQTTYHEKYSKLPDKTDKKLSPIWIDIFVLDRAPSEKWARKKLRMALLLRHFYYWSKCNINISLEDCFSEKAKCLIKKIVYHIFNIVKNPEAKIRRIFLKTVSKANGPLAVCFECANPGPLDIIFEYDKMFPVVPMKFEDIIVPLPKNWDEMLSYLFDDYMQLPPEEKRINHPPAVFDFGDGINVIENEVEQA